MRTTSPHQLFHNNSRHNFSLQVVNFCWKKGWLRIRVCYVILFILVSILGWSWWPLGLWWPWWIWLFINDSHDDHVYPYIQLGFEPGDDHDNHIHHHLFPGFDSGEDPDDHDNKDDHNTFHFGYEPGDEYGDHDHDNNDNHIYHNLNLDYNHDDHDCREYHGHHLWVISKMKTMIIMVIINIPRIITRMKTMINIFQSKLNT